ncbi:MAG: FAD-binding domain-containing protein [Marinagarivorans sp.]|nr:FAD-binding domain-containing protein [Marinagarivorans sp.]
MAAWGEGRTGYRFIDAAMRYLNATGWINFRMRAMLMSFASYDLWLPWQDSGAVLARKFIDYEPGIHWSQCQMQSGETGINTVRIYSPIKQSYDQDPDGRFIRQWVPELAGLPDGFLHEPWRMGAAELTALAPTTRHAS